MTEQALTAAAAVHDGAMIALVPTPEDAARMAVPGFEPAHTLHLTLIYLGRQDQWSPRQRIALEAELRRLETYPLQGFNWWNNDLGQSHQAGVYMIRSPEIENLHRQVKAIAQRVYGPDFPPDKFPHYLPHVTAGYGLSSERLPQVGPVQFDRMRLSFAGTYERDIPLGPSEQREPKVQTLEGTMAKLVKPWYPRSTSSPGPQVQGYYTADEVREWSRPRMK